MFNKTVLVLQRCKQRKSVLQIETNKVLAEHEMKKKLSAQNENMVSIS